MAKPPVKSQYLAEVLEQALREGSPKPGEWMPSERQLVEEHEVGRNTARQALKAVAERGLIQHVPGHGYRVAPIGCADTFTDQPDSTVDVGEELRAIRNQLEVINSRLTVIEGWCRKYYEN